jgi:hypothetical protein
MTTIWTLPVDVLRRIPTGYRQWKLLQMTSWAMDDRLGDYHIHHGIHSYDIDDESETSYTLLVRDIIESMKHDVCIIYGMYINCVYYDSDSDDNELDIDSSECIFQWYNRDMTIHKDGRVYHLDHVRDYETRVCGLRHTTLEHVIIYGRKYIPCMQHRGYTRALYTWIYNELPAVFSLMVIVKRLSYVDLV